MPNILELLFTLSRPVDRRTYAVAGFGLMALKLSVDLSVLYAATGRLWAPWEFLSLTSLLGDDVPMAAVRFLMVWALPFAWIGLSMTVRRTVDAGLSPWVGLLFCIPILNFALMIGLCFLPTKPRTAPEPAEAAGEHSSALRPIAVGLVVGLAMVFVGIFGLQDLGIVLFAGTPLGMGLVAGFVYNRGAIRTIGATTVLALATVAVAFGVLLLFAVEGVFCLVMALPLALPLAILGALLGRGVASLETTPQPSPLVMLVLILPLLAWAEPNFRRERLHAVTSRIEIDAAPEVVWAHLVAFEPLEPPRELWFRLGIAYPTQARIEGHGVGAVRYCEFSTGSFVEPITVWDEPRRLAFDVAAQPEPLRELSPYPHVHVDHLKGSLASRRGEFRLRPRADGGTILEGTTWYELSLYPEAYWSLWTDSLIRSIHLRVLRHVRRQVDQAGRSRQAQRIPGTRRQVLAR